MKEKSKLSRLERIKLESEKAIAYHQQAVDISLHENFRVEVGPVDPHNSSLLESTFLHGGNHSGILVEKNPFVIHKSVKSLVECLKGDLEIAELHPSQEVKDRILSTYHLLNNHYSEKSLSKEFRDKVLTIVFGRNFFKNSNEFTFPY